eukprot:scaffold257909_cov66-Attheya_sp.AAC.3
MRTLSFTRRWNDWVTKRFAAPIYGISNRPVPRHKKESFEGVATSRSLNLLIDGFYPLSTTGHDESPFMPSCITEIHSRPRDPADLDSYFHGRGRLRHRKACVLLIFFSGRSLVFLLGRDHWSGPLHNYFWHW